jgi:hypothetical protein
MKLNTITNILARVLGNQNSRKVFRNILIVSPDRVSASPK